MSVLNTGELYSKLLDDLKNLELELEESDDNESNENKLNELRRKICGCSLNSDNTNKTDDAKAAPESTRQIDEVSFYADLNSDTCTIEATEKICKLIAELSKDEECRNCFVDQNLFHPLDKCLSRPGITNQTRTQICRAIGNLCFYNDNGRLAFLKSCGIEKLLDLCKYCSTLDYTNSSDEDKKEKNTLISVVLGCLHNVTNENETLRNAAYEANVMSFLKDLAPFVKNFKGILIHFCSCVENLIELDEGKEQFVKEKVALKIYESLDEDLVLGLEEYSEDFFTILSSLNELDLSKDYLCQTDFLEKLFQIIENNLSNTELLRHIGLFIVNLLVKDEKVDMVFEYKNNLVLNKGIEWLDKYQNDQLFVTSAVIIANYMRSDENVSKMIKDPREPHVKILNILNKYSQIDSPTLTQINVIHSLLGAFRNFCVATGTREEILKHNVIEIALRFLNRDNLEVKFKALSIIRLLIKNCTNKTGLDLMFESKSLELVENVANNTYEHMGIVGESSRLVCYLPVAAKTEARIKEFCKFKLIGVICKQLKTEHLIMLNEALLALNVLITIDYRACYEQLKSSELNDNLMGLFLKESLPYEMRLNSLRLFKSLFDRNDFFADEQLKGHLEAFKKLKLSSNVDLLKTQLDQLIDLVENKII